MPIWRPHVIVVGMRRIPTALREKDRRKALAEEVGMLDTDDLMAKHAKVLAEVEGSSDLERQISPQFAQAKLELEVLGEEIENRGLQPRT